MQLIWDDHLDFAGMRGGVELRRGFRRGAEFWPAVHHGDARDVAQRQRPVDRRVAAAGDHHALAAQVVAAAHIVLDGA